jgi:hypothetical protein
MQIHAIGKKVPIQRTYTRKGVYIMRSYILLLICILPLQISAQEPQTAQSAEVEVLEKQLKEYKDQLALARMQAYIAGSDADQYLGEDWEDYQRAIAKQEQYEAQAQALEKKVAELKKQLKQKKVPVKP